MAEILNMALKKDVFEGLQNGTTNQIIIEKTNWWKKRLMDIDTGRFKPFEILVASCGSADKIEYAIEKIELVDENFIITVLNTPEDTPVQPEKEDMGDSDEPESFNEEIPTDDQMAVSISIMDCADLSSGAHGSELMNSMSAQRSSFLGNGSRYASRTIFG